MPTTIPQAYRGAGTGWHRHQSARVINLDRSTIYRSTCGLIVALLCVGIALAIASVILAQGVVGNMVVGNVSRDQFFPVGP